MKAQMKVFLIFISIIIGISFTVSYWLWWTQEFHNFTEGGASGSFLAGVVLSLFFNVAVPYTVSDITKKN